MSNNITNNDQNSNNTNNIKNIGMRTTFKKALNNTKERFLNFINKFYNITERNIQLGISHLKRGNISDAIFRFKFVDKFLDKDNKLANYWLGLCYLLNEKPEQATIYFAKAGDNDQLNFLEFTQNINAISSVPSVISSQRRNIKADDFIDKFDDEEINLPQLLVMQFNKNALDLPQEYDVLELGSNIGILGKELNQRLQGKFNLIGVESSSEMLDIYNDIYKEQSPYKKVHNVAVDQYLIRNDIKKDVIFSLDGFSYEVDLSNYLLIIYNLLNLGGYFTFAVRTCTQPKLSINLLEFSYPKDKIIEQLEEIGFKILSFDTFILENKNKYTIFACKK